MAAADNINKPQNFDINIDKIYSDFIGAIDSIRSNINITDPANLNLLKKFTEDSFSGSPTTSGLKAEQEPQESRCHAFYRILGLPVVSNSGIYNPGLDIIVEPGRTITLSQKVAIANNLLQGFLEISLAREQYVNDNLKIFSNNNSIDSCVLALSSSNIREFSSPFKKDASSVDFNIANQSYIISKESLIGNNSKVTFDQYIGFEGTTPTKFSTTRYHLIKPFMVDPRIDLTTTSDKKIAIPFVRDKLQLRVNETKYVARPLIEKIIRDRFGVANQKANIGSLPQTVVDDILNNDTIKDSELVQKVVSGKLYNLSEQQQFLKYLGIIYSMIDKLTEAQKTILDAQSQYYWLPIPSKTGPEAGCTVSPIYQKIPAALLTQKDLAVVAAGLKDVTNQLNSQAATVLNQTDVGGFLLPAYTITYNNDTTNALGDNNAESLKQLTGNRDSALSEANTALRTIEIIMGEFSGFGLCDIIAIMGALYVMPANSLLGFLDRDAYSRAKEVKELGLPEQNPVEITDALVDLSKTVSDFYNIMDKIYKDFYSV
jgi:hypothetical protein